MDKSFEIKVTGIEHLGLAPKNPEKACWFFEHALGLPAIHREVVETQQVETLIFSSSQDSIHGGNESKNAHIFNKLEILKSLGADGPVSKFLEKKGGGIHHVALTVKDLPQVIQALKSKGVRMIHDSPVPGVEGTQIAFVHPESTGGILLELVNDRDD